MAFLGKNSHFLAQILIFRQNCTTPPDHWDFGIFLGWNSSVGIHPKFMPSQTPTQDFFEIIILLYQKQKFFNYLILKDTVF